MRARPQPPRWRDRASGPAARAVQAPCAAPRGPSSAWHPAAACAWRGPAKGDPVAHAALEARRGVLFFGLPAQPLVQRAALRAQVGPDVEEPAHGRIIAPRTAGGAKPAARRPRTGRGESARCPYLTFSSRARGVNALAGDGTAGCGVEIGRCFSQASPCGPCYARCPGGGRERKGPHACTHDRPRIGWAPAPARSRRARRPRADRDGTGRRRTGRRSRQKDVHAFDRSQSAAPPRAARRHLQRHQGPVRDDPGSCRRRHSRKLDPDRSGRLQNLEQPARAGRIRR